MNARHRLRRREDFARLRSDGRVFRHALLHLSVVTNDLLYNRYGYITSKALGKAVQRNRVRRLLREAVRRRHDDVQPGFDILLIARTPVVGKSLDAIGTVLDELLKRADLLRKKENENFGTGADTLL